MNSSYDVLIAGAGIVGAACAFELAKAKLRVAIVDRSFPPRVRPAHRWVTSSPWTTPKRSLH